MITDWANALADEFVNRNNDTTPIWTTCDVVSPVWDDDKEKYVGPLIIMAYDGQITLGETDVIGRTSNLHEGMTVNLIGNIFSGQNRKLLIAGSAEYGATLSSGEPNIITDGDVMQAEIAEAMEIATGAYPHAQVTTERDLNNITDDGVFFLLGVTAGDIINSPECVYDGNYIVINHMTVSNGIRYGMQIYGRLTGGSARVQYYYRYCPTAGWGDWFKIKTDYRGMIYRVDADNLHNEAGHGYSGGYTLSYNSSNPNANFPFNASLAYVDIDCLQYAKIQDTGICYRPYRQTFVPALTTHTRADTVYTRVLRVIVQDCVRATDGRVYHAGDVYDKTEWHRQVTDTEYNALLARVEALEELTGISDLSTLTLNENENVEESIAEQEEIE